VQGPAIAPRRTPDDFEGPDRAFIRYAAGPPKGAFATNTMRGKAMRIILLAGAVLALSACGGGESANDANNMAADNMMMDGNMMMGDDMMMDDNGAMNSMGNMGTMGAPGAGGAMGNGAMDANTQNMMRQDATTNDPDTNLANGI
jgi:hypothetical protein